MNVLPALSSLLCVAKAQKVVDELYKEIITAGTHMASSIKVAEAAKFIESAQRDPFRDHAKGYDGVTNHCCRPPINFKHDASPLNRPCAQRSLRPVTADLKSSHDRKEVEAQSFEVFQF